MAMERFRTQLMQQDKSGVYRVNTSLVHPTASPSTSPVKGQTSPTGLAAPAAWTLSSSEASAHDHYGHPDGYLVGSIFADRKACMDAHVHRATMKGIVGNSREGAYSVVVNDGYEDDIDEGDVIWYTGAGGQEVRGGSEPQRTDQSFEHPSNASLLRNTFTKHPVRVIRGSKNSKWGPFHGYRYDGLYDVLSAEYAKGKSGFRICRYKLQSRGPFRVWVPTTTAYHHFCIQRVSNMSQEPEDVKPKLSLSIHNYDGNSITVKVRPNMPFGKIFNAALKKFEKEPGSLRFLYDGKRIQEEDTPASMEMEDGDQIDAQLPQIGGGLS
ncbi:hypothetical protein NP233_g7141 [Leucocoprinus birnbaumii]|uniref:Uncharacterized protein n=1 Tax=Leucocoprinus birnbaumii TaxID=56174 RepID=A0AAD5VS55_9AGAR|nr:hypothetical protein NP233_g7141 [Leucocoprinus birnbaumii]